MPKSPRRPERLVRAPFIGGPLDGTSAPALGHEHVVRATLEPNGAERHWHWYEAEIDDDGVMKYRYVGSEKGGWPKRYRMEE